MATLALSMVGMGAAGTAGTAVVGALSLFTAASSLAQGQHAADLADRQAFQEGLSAKDKEIARRRQTLEVLAAQNVAAATGGITGTGSVKIIQQQTQQQGDDDLLAIRANSAATQQTLRGRASNAVRSGRLSAATSLLQGMTQVSQLKGN